MQGAPARRYSALFMALALMLLGILLFALLGGEHASVTVFTGRSGAFVLPEWEIPDGAVNVNTADKAELMRLFGIGESIAEEIIREREKNGPFRFPEDLLAVKGIGEKKLERLLPDIRLDDRP